MAWFQVDDQLAMHRKVCEAGNAAMGLWVRAGAWSMQNLTEGFIPAKAAKTLGTPAQTRALLDAGLWVNTEGGYQFHEWGTRQMSADQIAERRRKRAEAGRKGGQSKPGTKPEATEQANAQASASDSLKQMPEQNRTPVPVPALVGVTLGGNGTEVNARNSQIDPPQTFDENHARPTRCAVHQGIENPPNCHACREARERFDARQAQARRSAIDARRAELEQAAIDRAVEIAECELCDDDGYRGAVVCDHREHSTAETRAAAMAAIRGES